jgi:hypothetical protein
MKVADDTGRLHAVPASKSTLNSAIGRTLRADVHDLLFIFVGCLQCVPYIGLAGDLITLSSCSKQGLSRSRSRPLMLMSNPMTTPGQYTLVVGWTRWSYYRIDPNGEMNSPLRLS